MPMMINTDWQKRARFLTQILILSGALNIALIATFFTVVMKEKQEAVAFDMTPSQPILAPLSNETLLSQYAMMSYAELLSLLENGEPAEAGYKKRDLALGALISFHFFPLEKAISVLPSQPRTLSFIHPEGQEKADVQMIPGLTDDHYAAILNFAKTEKWPLRPEGLFYEIQHSKPPLDPSLLEAFYLTPEFYLIFNLFSHTGFSIEKPFLIELLAQGDWKSISQFTEDQKKMGDITSERLKFFLVSWVQKRSTLASQMLMDWDPEYIVRRLGDDDLLVFLDVYPGNRKGYDAFLKNLLQSPRSDAIWKKAGEKLAALGVAPAAPPKEAIASQPVTAQKKYVVQEGDSLWKIARKHKVSVEAIKKENNLETDRVRVGRTLIIPN
ncbi:MAG: LysM peptidoglycan-binding domain-containing protein [Verrucomicrobia bacterium]|nr:LysM peptidoglycan-binding domain-containing protein [Verrucomicrobiota bacterium]